MYSTAAPHPLPPRPNGRQPKPVSPVDLATPADFEDLVRFLRMMREEIVCDDDLLISAIEALVNRHGGVAFVVRGDGREPIEASMGLCFVRVSPLSWAYRMQSVWNLVLPEKRARTGHLKSLLLAAKVLALRSGIPAVIDEWGAPDLPKNKLCSRHLSLVRVMFSTEVPPVAAVG